jgi:coenzyme F420-reducing hydrogenase alpha subunit
MNAPSSLEGVIKAKLRLKGGRIQDVSVEPRQTPPLAALLRGKSPGEAALLIPRLFSLCGTAQSVACRYALEMAQGCEAPGPERARRQILVLAETVGEHAKHLLLDAPLAFDETPGVAGLKDVRKHLAGLKALLADAPVPAQLAEWQDGLRLLLLSQVMGASDAAGLSTMAQLEGWCETGQTAPARVLGKILTAGLAGFGASATQLMGPLPLDRLIRVLGREGGLAFARAPLGDDGQCQETGPLARQREHPLIQSLYAGCGHGLAARLAARLIELSHAVTGIALSLPLLESCQTPKPKAVDGEGVGVAEAARGRLVHWVAIRGGLVEDYRLLAPTEWNFHPNGAFRQGLLGVAAQDAQEAASKARWQAQALDPCVSLEVEVSDA